MKTILLMPLEANSYNYGGVLQEYALQCVCRKLGYKTEIINDVFTERRGVFSVKNDIRNFTFSWLNRKLKEKLISRKIHYSKFQIEQIEKRHQSFENFRSKYMQFTPQCSQKDLKEIASEAYAIICGSDQIWNPILTSYPLFLTFAKPDQITIAYAASISREHLSKHEMKVMKSLIPNIKHISVRESKAEEILSGMIDKDIKVVLDPTMLVDEKIWYNMTKHRIVEKKYILCYFLGDNLRIRKQVEDYAKKNNLKLIAISCMSLPNARVDELYNYISYADAGPEEFINLIRYAEYVVADSFHAAVFSILFRKQFFIIGRKMAGQIANSRLDTLFSYFGLESHLGECNCMSEVLQQSINYDEVYSKLLCERKRSHYFLENALNEN